MKFATLRIDQENEIDLTPGCSIYMYMELDHGANCNHSVCSITYQKTPLDEKAFFEISTAEKRKKRSLVELPQTMNKVIQFLLDTKDMVTQQKMYLQMISFPMSSQIQMNCQTATNKILLIQ